MSDPEKPPEKPEKNGEAPDGGESDGGAPGGGAPEADLSASIGMAFNLGVSFNQQAQGAKSIAQALAEMGEHIFTSLNKAHGGNFRQEYIIANTEYLLQIALLGYIIPSICDYEDNFKERLLALIEARARKQGAPGPGDKTGGGPGGKTGGKPGGGGGGGRIITP